MFGRQKVRSSIHIDLDRTPRALASAVRREILARAALVNSIDQNASFTRGRFR